MIAGVRGTRDILPGEVERWQRLEEVARDVCRRYGYHEIRTPVLERESLFAKGTGESTDIVQKEMYTFTDKGGDKVTLRPENTAGIARCFISEGLAHSAPLKVFYSGPMFRYERPQKGRLRQFHQIGVELIGVAQPQADIEVIACGVRVLDDLGVLANTVLE